MRTTFLAGWLELTSPSRGHEVTKKQVLPEPSLPRIAHFAEQPDLHAALRAFRDELRATP